MFQANKWSWKRVAANLLLVPVLGGGAVAEGEAHADGAGGPAGDRAEARAPAGPAAPAEAGPVARWLSAGALVAALAALGVTLLRRRRA